MRQPKIFLFDEPLSNLDAALRSEMRIELMGLHKRLGSTMIYVTHDQVEAMTMADKIVVLDAGTHRAGRLARSSSTTIPTTSSSPASSASPKMNFLDGVCTAASASGVTVDLKGFGSITTPHKGSGDLVGKPLTLGIRPEHQSLSKAKFTLPFTPAIVERLGIHTIAYSPLPSGENFISLFEGNPQIEPDKPMEIGVDPAKCHLFTADGQALSRR